jgi:hypothetical protein
LATTRRPDGLAKELVRVAIVGRREFLILRLICVGPPTDYELNLMDQVARSIQLDPGLYLPADKQARQIGVRLGSGPQAGNWVALAKTLPLDGLVLLPTTDGGKAGDPGFWGAVRIRKDSLLPNGDIKRLLADRAANPLARLLGRPVEPDEWTFARDGGESDLAGGGSGSLPAVEQRKVGGLAVWQIRGVDHDRDVVRLRLAFRPAVLQPGEDSDSADSPTSPAGAAGATGPAGAAGAQPGPGAPAAAVFATRQAIVLDAWSAAADEPAATAAIDRLIQSLRVP